jgi:hypothetical protein
MAGAILVQVIPTLIALGLESFSYFIHAPTTLLFQGLLAVWLSIAFLSDN